MSIETKTPPRQGKLLSFSENRFGYLAVLAALAIGIYTIYTLAQFDPAQSDSGQLATLIAVDVLAVIIVGAFVIRQILRLWVERRQKLAGYQLHWRLAHVETVGLEGRRIERFGIERGGNEARGVVEGAEDAGVAVPAFVDRTPTPLPPPAPAEPPLLPTPPETWTQKKRRKPTLPSHLRAKRRK